MRETQFIELLAPRALATSECPVPSAPVELTSHARPKCDAEDCPPKTGIRRANAVEEAPSADVVGSYYVASIAEDIFLDQVA